MQPYRGNGKNPRVADLSPNVDMESYRLLNQPSLLLPTLNDLPHELSIHCVTILTTARREQNKTARWVQAYWVGAELDV